MNAKRLRQILLAGCHLVAGNAAARYDAWHLLLSYLTRKTGGRAYNPYMSWFRDTEYLSNWKDFPITQPVIADRKFNLLHLATATRDVPGDTAECGVFEGASSYLIMKAHDGTEKLHHIFDSFEGLSEPESQDSVTKPSVYKWKAQDLAVSQHVVDENLNIFSQRRLYKGWIPERFPEVSERQFSLVHIDVDLYQPTYDSLAFFYERVSPGGMIVCDDYGSEACPGAYRAITEWMADKPEHVIHLTTGQGLIIKR